MRQVTGSSSWHYCLLPWAATAVAMLVLHVAPAGKPARSLPHIALTAAACCWAVAACRWPECNGSSSSFVLAAAEAHVLLPIVSPPPPSPLPLTLLLPILNELQRTALGAAALLAFPQILRTQFAKLLGTAAAQDLRRGGGPAVLLLSILAAAAATGAPVAGPASAAAAAAAVAGATASGVGQALVVVFALLIMAGAVTAPEPNANWLDAPHPVARRLHGRLNQLAFAVLLLLLVLDFGTGCSLMHVESVLPLCM